MFSKKAFICLLCLVAIIQLNITPLYAQDWSECNDYIGKWKFGKNSVLEITKGAAKDEQPQFNFEGTHYKDWKYSSSEYKKSEWHFVFERDPKADEINSAIPTDIREEISRDGSSNKNTWYLEIVLKRDEASTMSAFSACNNKLKLTWYKGIINWDKTTKKLRKVYNYPMTEAKFSPYYNEDKEKITDHIEEYTGNRVTYEIPDWNSLVFDWKTDPMTLCAIQAKKKINEYFLSKTATHAFTELFKAMKPATSNPIGETVWGTIWSAIGGVLEGLAEGQAKNVIMGKFKDWCTGEYDFCRYDIVETHAIYSPQGYLENKAIGATIFLIFVIDKYLGSAHCIIIVGPSDAKNPNGCKETLTISCDIPEKFPEKSIEGGGMKKWHLMGELPDVTISSTPQPSENGKSPCNPSAERVTRVQTAFNNAKSKSAAQKTAMDNAFSAMKAAEKQHADYLKVKSDIAEKQKEINNLNDQIKQLQGANPGQKRKLENTIAEDQKDVLKLHVLRGQLEAGEAGYQDKSNKYYQAKKAWQDAFCQWMQNAINAEKWSNDDIIYFKNCYYDDELKGDFPKCN